MVTLTKKVTPVILPRTTETRNRNDVAVGATERARILHSVKGMWKNRKPDPIRELKKMRAEWNNAPR